ncbi:hypothetical protein L7F22_011424 [Adiantum nelumboides]|nr:hypothetical protein [Adiantum nelumboides]
MLWVKHVLSDQRSGTSWQCEVVHGCSSDLKPTYPAAMGAQHEIMGDNRSSNLAKTNHGTRSSSCILSSYRGHRGGVTCVKFRPLMKHLVSGGSDGSVLMWGLFCRSSFARHHTQIRPYRFLGHQGEVCAVAVSPLDTVVASAARDKTVRLWVPTAEGKGSIIRAHSSTVRTVAFSPDGECLLSGGDDKALKIWDVETERFLAGLSGHMNWVRSAEFNSSGRLIVSGGDDKTIRLWDTEKQECVHIFTDILGMVNCTRFHPHGSCIGSSSGQAIQIWDIRSKMLIQHYAGNAGTVKSISFHPSGNFILSACDDATLKIWDLREGKIFRTIKGHEGPTTCAEFSPQGDHFASGSQDEQVMLWQSNFKQVRKPFVLGSSLRDASCFAPSNDEIVKQNEKASSDSAEMVHVKEDSFLSDSISTPTQATLEVSKDRDPVGDGRVQHVEDLQRDASERIAKDIQKGAQGLNNNEDAQKGPHIAEDVHEPHSENVQETSTTEAHENNGSVVEAPSSYPTRLAQTNQDRSCNLDLPETRDLAMTLEHLISQMDTLTKTITVFEERLSHIEDKVINLEKIGSRRQEQRSREEQDLAD